MYAVYDFLYNLIPLCNEVAESGSASAAQICETSAFAIIQLAPLFIILPFIILTLTEIPRLSPFFRGYAGRGVL